MIAYHEAGHALVGRILPNADPVYKISIIARGVMGGWTRFLPTEDRHLWTRSQFEDKLAVNLGGRAGEEIAFNEISTGAQNDLEQATRLARKMVTEYGMSDKLGPRTFGHREESPFLGREMTEHRNYSETVAQEIDEEVQNLIQKAYNTAKKTLTENKAKLKQLAEYLITEETLEGERLEALFKEPVPSAS